MLVDWDEMLGLLDMSIELASSLMVADLDRLRQRTEMRVVKLESSTARNMLCW
jgi:hypothetical protein